MSILADCCAGATRARVTDRGESYASLNRIIGSSVRGAPKGKKYRQEQLVPITLRTIGLQSVKLKKLIAFREREAREAGYAIRELRHRYLDVLERYVTRLTTQSATQSDAEVILSEFDADMRHDLKRLQRDLSDVGLNALLSKEMLVTALTAVGTVASWALGAPLTIEGELSAAGVPLVIGGLYGTANKYFAARRSVLEEHPMAYLYELKRSL